MKSQDRTKLRAKTGISRLWLGVAAIAGAAIAYLGDQERGKARRPVARGIDADVAVVGAGPAGAAAALFAAARGHRVIIFDKQAFPRDKPCGEGLMPGGRPALRELGLEENVVSGGAPPLRGIQFGR